MKKLLSMLLFIAGLLLYIRHAAADTITCADTADVYIDQCLTCTTPEGTPILMIRPEWLFPTIPLKGIARGLLKFDIPADNRSLPD